MATSACFTGLPTLLDCMSRDRITYKTNKAPCLLQCQTIIVQRLHSHQIVSIQSQKKEKTNNTPRTRPTVSTTTTNNRIPTMVLLASLFGLASASPAPKASSASKTTRLHPRGDNIRYSVTIIRWTEFQNGKKVDSDVYLDFDDVECEDCEINIDEEDWDGEDFDDDAEDWQETKERGFERKDGLQNEKVLSLRHPEGGLRREREADVWRTRLGGEQ